MSYPTTDDTATRIALPPDWREGVNLTQVFETTVQRSRAGLEQRNRRRNRAKYILEYTRTGLTPAEAKGRLEAIRAEYRGPLIVPMWTDAIALQSNMVSATSALLESNPVDNEWEAPFDVWLWTSDFGGQWRTVTAIDGRNLTLSGTGTLYPAGALVFPSRVMIRENAESMLQVIDLNSGVESHRYRTL